MNPPTFLTFNFNSMIKKITIHRVRQLTIALLLLASFTGPQRLYAQTHQVTGTVKSEAGEVLPGVVIRVKGAQGGATTGATGTYTVNAGSGSATLIYSFIGYA